MRLILDHNLSPHLPRRLAEAYPESTHVSEVGLERASDLELWEYAIINDLAIVSKDSDFMQLSFLRGAPPKVIWIRTGNSSTEDIEQLLSASVEAIREFISADGVTYLILPLSS